MKRGRMQKTYFYRITNFRKRKLTTSRLIIINSHNILSHLISLNATQLSFGPSMRIFQSVERVPLVAQDGLLSGMWDLEDTDLR